MDGEVGNFYCMVKTCEISQDPEYQKAYNEIMEMDISNSEKRKLLNGPPCPNQCESCKAVVDTRRRENKEKYGW
jgi:hypothetical protein